MKCMVDTCVFNWLIDGKIIPEQLPTGAEYFITHVQRDEISAVSSVERKAKLLGKLHAMVSDTVLTETMVVGISRVGEGKLSDGRDYEGLLAALNRKKKHKNNPKDALIGETALKNRFTLISADRALCEVMKSAGASVLLFDQSIRPTSTQTTK